MVVTFSVNLHCHDYVIEEISSFFGIEQTVDSTVEATLTCVEKHLGLT